MSLEQYFSTGEPFEKRVFDAVFSHLITLGELHIEFVSVGIFFKREHTFAELRQKRDRVVLSILLSRRLDKHPRITRTYHTPGGGRSAYFIPLRDAKDVDDEVRDWLTESYFASPVHPG
jgi:hypothetical protein